MVEETPERDEPAAGGQLEVNPLGVAILVALLAVTVAVLVPERWFSDEAPEPDRGAYAPDDFEPPDSLPDAPLDQQRVSLDADFAYDLPGAPGVRVFIVQVADAAYSAVGYRSEEGRYERLGGLHHPTGFEAPALEGSPPRLGMMERRLRVPFVFRASEDQLHFEPAPEANVGPEEVVPGPSGATLKRRPVYEEP